MKRPFDLEKAMQGKPVVTRNGTPVRILCIDAKGDKPIVALVALKDDVETTERYSLDGKYFPDDDTNECVYDLMMEVEKKSGWVNIDERGRVWGTYKTERDAKLRYSPDTVACIEITWEE